MKQLKSELLTALVLGCLLVPAPAFAETTPAWQAMTGTDWQGMTHSEKRMFLRGVLTGIGSNAALHSALTQTMPPLEESMMTQFIIKHPEDLESALDEFYQSHPKGTLALPTFTVMGAYVQSDPKLKAKIEEKAKALTK